MMNNIKREKSEKPLLFRIMFKKGILLLLLIFFFIGITYAEKAESYVPPPYSYRLLCSFIALTPLSFFTFLLSYLYFKLVEKLVEKRKLLKLLFAMTIPLILSCLLAATDAYNDEGWSPISAALFLPLYVPFAIPILGRKLKLWQRTLIGICVFLVLIIFIGSIEIPYRDLIYKTNLPVTW